MWRDAAFRDKQIRVAKYSLPGNRETSIQFFFFFSSSLICVDLSVRLSFVEMIFTHLDGLLFYRRREKQSTR